MSKDDLEREAIRILSQLPGDKNLSSEKMSFFNLINSPFFITIIGGLLIGIITLIAQDKISDSNRIQQENRETYMLKYELLTEFSDGMIACLEQTYDMRLRSIWLRQTKKEDKNWKSAVYFDGRSFFDTRDLWEKQRNESNKLKNPDSLCAQVKAMYHSEEVIMAINELDSIMDTYFETNDRDTLKIYFSDANQKYQDIIALMGEELYNDRRVVQ